MNKTAIVHCEHFNTAHRLHYKNWSDEKIGLFLGNVITLTITLIIMS